MQVSLLLSHRRRVAPRKFSDFRARLPFHSNCLKPTLDLNPSTVATFSVSNYPRTFGSISTFFVRPQARVFLRHFLLKRGRGDIDLSLYVKCCRISDLTVALP